MKKILCAAFVLLALMTAACGAQAQSVFTYTYGGSGRDWLSDMATSDNGLIAMTGWTESSDGTLAARTKTGRSGWLLVIDREGKEIVNFCTRLGSHDNLSYPVFHADGTLTVMLFAEDADVGWVKLELLRLDMDGKVLSRKVIAEKGGNEESYISIVGHDERGYILQERSYQGEGYTYYDVIDYDGNRVKRLDSWHQLYAVADAHVIHADGQDGKSMFLYRSADEGGEAKLCKVFDLREGDLRPVMYDGFLSLPDGGAAGCGWVLDEKAEEKTRLGLFTRWDAEGNIISEMRTPGWGYGEIALRPGGFAATAYPWDEMWVNDVVWMIYLLDANGMLQGTIPLTSDAQSTGHNACIGALGDGTIVAAHVVPVNGEDTVVTIVRP